MLAFVHCAVCRCPLHPAPQARPFDQRRDQRASCAASTSGCATKCLWSMWCCHLRLLCGVQKFTGKRVGCWWYLKAHIACICTQPSSHRHAQRHIRGRISQDRNHIARKWSLHLRARLFINGRGAALVKTCFPCTHTHLYCEQPRARVMFATRSRSTRQRRLGHRCNQKH